jgi:hypothetical protein
MYGIISTIPAPVEMYDAVHGEILRRFGAFDGLLVHIGRTTTDGFQVVEVWESKEHYDRANTDHVFPLMQGTGRRSAATLDGAGDGNFRCTRP